MPESFSDETHKDTFDGILDGLAPGANTSEDAVSLQRVATYLDAMAMFRAILAPGEDGVPRLFGPYEVKKVLGMGG